MKNAFLNRIVDTLLKHPERIETTSLVLPGKRPEVFIKNLFKEKRYEGYMPQFYSIIDFAAEITKLTPVNGIPLLLEAYKVFVKIDPNVSFENFLKWAPTVLKDFDEISIYTQDPNEILTYMVDIERIENWGIENFESTELLQQNKNFWEKLKPFYFNLYDTLSKKNQATSGELLREAALQSKEFSNQNKDASFIFAGFNALSKAELDLFQTFAQSSQTTMLWDVDAYYFDQEYQEAGAFLRKYQKDYPDFKVDAEIEHNLKAPKNFNSLAASKQVIQAKYIGEVWKNIQPDEIENSAIVLCDENALGSVLDSVPDSIENVNITMGYPILKNGTSLFFQKLFSLQKRSQDKENMYAKDLLDLLHSFVLTSPNDKKLVKEFENELIKSKKIYINPDEFPVLQKISASPLLQLGQSVIELLKKCESYCETQSENSINNKLQRSIFQKLGEVFQEMVNVSKTLSISYEVLPQIFTLLLKNAKIDFIGEPLEGLQIMGLLETRLLNFKNLILLNVNEGTLPLGRSENSFIPYDVKRKFGIDTFLENDSIYAYHFLRLLQRAERADMLYNTVSDGVNVGEKSRFLLQLEIESPELIKENSIVLANDVSEFQERMEFPKTEKMQQLIKNWYSKNISPSALGSYLYDPIVFMKSKILRLKEIEEYEDEFSVRTTGIIIHKTLELLYEPFLSKENAKGLAFTAENLERLLPEIPEYMDKAMIAENYSLDWFKKGINLIEKRISQRMIENLVKQDIKQCKEGNKIEIISLENRDTEYTYEHPELGTLKFSGIVDRIDKINGILRVVDYKTGSIKDKKLEVIDKEGNLIPLGEKDRYRLQLILYAQMVFNTYKVKELQAGLYGLKSLKEGIKYLEFKKSTIFNQEQANIAFESVADLVSEIANPDIPFLEKEKQKYDFTNA